MEESQTETEPETEVTSEEEATSEQEAKTVIIEKHYYKEEEKEKGAITSKHIQEDSDEKEYKDRIIIRSYSSMILLIPSLITALVCGLVQMLMNRYTTIPLDDRTQGSGYMNIIGIVFFIIFILNIILIAFDFNRARTIIIIVLIIAIIAILLLVNAYTGFLSGAGDGGGLPTMRIYFSSQVYFGLATLMFFIILFTWFGSLFNYYAVEGNELLHHKGIGGGVERYPAADMSVIKEYPDIIEYLIFRSGTLVLTPPRTDRAIILKNVIGINKKVDQMNEILSRLKVDVN
ncbi:MAG: hypothetical protein EAX90_03240 [Candidatus Heimdallarchaeota archaeon]|nr:hypothetical protein [Candidatus Heimdallarchaeota archaeon]